MLFRSALAARAPKRVRSAVAAKPAKARRVSGGGSAFRGSKQQSGSDSGSHGTTTQAANAQQQLDGPSASRKAADHRRLLKSYMKALFRHLKLPVEYKSASSATYRDRINNALSYWFGDSFAPGKTTRECHAPKVVCALVRIATSGRVLIRPENVSEILVKGIQAKNANYAVSAAALRKHKIADSELRAMFDGDTRVDAHGWPRGTPLKLPDCDEALPAFDVANSNAKGLNTGSGQGLSPVKEEAPKGGDTNGAGFDGEIGVGRAKVVKGTRSKRGGGSKKNEPAATTPAAAKIEDRVGDSPLFSPVGHVAAAFAAAALMPDHSDRSEAAKQFVSSMVDPLVRSVKAHADPAPPPAMQQPYSPPDAASPSRPSKRR